MIMLFALWLLSIFLINIIFIPFIFKSKNHGLAWIVAYYLAAIISCLIFAFSALVYCLCQC